MMPFKLRFWNTIFKIECPAVFSPAIKYFIFCSWFTEIFHFHLFKFCSTENEVFKDDFITERFTNLCHTKRYFHTVRLNNVFEVCKNTLTCFWTKINKMSFICNWSLICFEHKVEFTNCCIFSFFTATNWTINIIFNKRFHFFMSHGINRFSRICFWMCCYKVFNHFICTMTSLTFQTVNHWIREVISVS